MPQPGINGMEPVFGKAYGSHRCLLTSGQFAISPLEGRTEHDQETPKGVVQMLGSPAVPRKRPFELLSDLLDDGFSEDLHHERWDISALDDITHYTKVDLEGEPVSSDSNVTKRRSSTEEPPERASDLGRVQSQSSCDPHGPTDRSGSAGVLKSEAAGEPEAPCRKVIPSSSTAGSLDPSSPSALEHRSEEHNYSLHVDRDSGTSQGSDSETEDTEEEDERGEAEEEIAEDKDSSFSESECDPESESQASTRPTKRQCFWECSHSYKAGSKREMGKVPHSWKSHTLPSTLYLREEASANGKICPRKARKTDASDLTPNPQKLQSIGDQLHKLNMAIEGMRPVNDLPIVARVRSRKEKNKLASRACRLKKKAQHEANKIKLWGLNQEYDSLLGVLLRIKGIIRRRVESREEDHGTGMMKQLEEILRESSGPCVAGRTKEFVESILEQSAGGQRAKRPQKRDPAV